MIGKRITTWLRALLFSFGFPRCCNSVSLSLSRPCVCFSRVGEPKLSYVEPDVIQRVLVAFVVFSSHAHAQCHLMPSRLVFHVSFF